MRIVASPAPRPEVGGDLEVAPGHVRGHGRRRRASTSTPRAADDRCRRSATRDQRRVEGDAGSRRARWRRGPSRGPRRTTSTCTSWLRGHRPGRRRGPRRRTRAPVTWTRDDLGGALGVADHLLGEVGARLGHGVVERRLRSTGPAAPLASRSTVSLVEVQPSTVEGVEACRPRRARSAAVSCAGRRPAASVVSTASIVAMLGASIAAPLAMPPTAKPVARARRPPCARVSVVMIASAARGSARRPTGPATRAGMPAASASIGSGMPMSPVEHTSTSSAVARRARPRRRRTSPRRRRTPGLAGGGVGVAAVEDDRRGLARRVRGRCACVITHRRGGHQVAG